MLGETVNYTYDALNRLVAATATNNNWGEAYSFDGFGNLQSKTPTVGTAPTVGGANPADILVVGETLKATKSLATEWALPELLAGARANGDPERRSLFAWALAAYPANAEAEQTLLDVVASDNDGEVREHAIESLCLGEFRSEKVLKL